MIETNTHTPQEQFELAIPGHYELAAPRRARVESIGERIHDDETVRRVMGALSLSSVEDSHHMLADASFWTAHE